MAVCFLLGRISVDTANGEGSVPVGTIPRCCNTTRELKNKTTKVKGLNWFCAPDKYEVILLGIMEGSIQESEERGVCVCMKLDRLQGDPESSIVN